MGIVYQKLPSEEDAEIVSKSRGRNTTSISTSSNGQCRMVLLLSILSLLLVYYILGSELDDSTILSVPRQKVKALNYRIKHLLNIGQSISNMEGDWQLAFGHSWGDRFYGYSAYLDQDEDGNRIVRVIAVTPSYSTLQINCLLQNENYSTQAIVPGYIQTGTTYIDTKYSAAFIICTLDNTLNESAWIPSFVSFSEDVTTIAKSETGRFRIYPDDWRQEDKISLHSFGVCVQPIYNYDKALEIIQWIEYNVMMGATYFVFYNMSIGPTVSCILKSYQSTSGLVMEILPWSIPITDDDLLHNNAQYAQADECVFRARGKTDHLIMIDFDEYIVPNPKFAKNYAQLLAKAEVAANNTGAVQYAFLNGIFNVGCKDGEDSINIGDVFSVDDLILHRYVARTEPLYNQQVKFITTPRLVIEPGIHNLAAAVNKTFVQVLVESELAYLHHYKWYPGGNCSNPDRIDKTGIFFAKMLFNRVKAKQESLRRTCDM